MDTQGLLELTINIFLLKGNTLFYYKEILMIKAFNSIFDIPLCDSLYHAFLLIGGTKMKIVHIQIFTRLRLMIPCTLLPLSDDFSYFYRIFYKRLRNRYCSPTQREI
jgi:hypothetical protein